MTVKDVLGMSFGNLWRMKVRSLLTISGVIIGIMALSSLLSFGVGMQENVSEQFRSMGLFTSLQVLPAKLEKTITGSADTTHSPALDDSALMTLSQLPGVKFVYPEDAFQAMVEYGDTSANTTAHSLPVFMSRMEPWTKLTAGKFFSSDSATEIIVQRGLAKKLGYTKPDSILGREIELVTARINPGAAMGALMTGGRISPFAESRRKFTICGVTDFNGGMGYTRYNLFLPLGTAQTIDHLSFQNSFDLLKQMKRGNHEYAVLTVQVRAPRDFETVRDSVEARGFHTFSLTDQFEEMKKAFLIFDAMLGAIGIMALTVASLGIANTMIMSITERYREIGILKSLGADDRQIRLLFLAESGAVGFIGGVVGLILGWLLTRVASVFIKMWMEKQGQPTIEMFLMPLWLMLASVAFGVAVSLLAGALPSRRAAKVDPVQSLRHD